MEIQNRFIKYLFKFSLSFVSGLLLLSAFVPYKYFFIIFISFIPLMFAVRNENPFKAFILGLITGLTLYIFHYHWLTVIWGKKFVLLLIFYISLYYAAFAFLISAFKLLEKISISKIFIISTIWITGEMLRSTLIGGFAGASIAHALFEKPVLIQISELGGFFLVSFFVMWINSVLFSFLDRKLELKHKLRIAYLTAGILLIILIFSIIRFNQWEKPPGDNYFKVCILQPSIEQHKKWDPGYRAEVFKLIEETFPENRSGYDLVIFPETVCPTEFRYEYKSKMKIIQYSREFSPGYIFFGSEDFTPEPFLFKKKRLKFNSSFVVKDGEIKGKYDKILPVTFAENNPFKKKLPWFNRFIIGEPIEPGTVFTVLEVEKHDDPNTKLKIGTLICLESVLPYLSRGFIKNGANILINLSNEAWFMMHPTSADLLASSLFRSVEFRKFLIKCSNTGISSVITPSGRIIFRTELFHRTFKEAVVYPIEYRTLYSRIEENYIFFLLIISGFLLIFGKKKKEKLN